MTWWKQEAAGADWWVVARQEDSYDPTLHVEILRLPSEHNDGLAPYLLDGQDTLGKLPRGVRFRAIGAARFVAQGLRDLHGVLLARLVLVAGKERRDLDPFEADGIRTVLLEASQSLDAWKTLWAAAQLGATFSQLVDLAMALRNERSPAQEVVRG